MLKKINIHNYLFFHDCSIEFNDRLNVISGETGSGKTLFIHALAYLQGKPSRFDKMNTHKKNAQIQYFFLSDDLKIKLILEEFHIPVKENLHLCIHLSLPKESFFINEMPVDEWQFHKLGQLLIDIHFQNENQKIFSPPTQLAILDEYLNISASVRSFTEEFQKYKNKLQELVQLDKQEEELRELKLFYSEFLHYILKYNIKDPQEKAKLIKEKELLDNHQDILDKLNFSKQALEVKNQKGILYQLQNVIQSLKNSTTDFSQNYPKRLESCFYELDDILYDINTFISNFKYNPGQKQHIEERLSLIYTLEKRFQIQPFENLDEYIQKAKEIETNNLNYQDNRVALKNSIQTLEDNLYTQSQYLSEQRRQGKEKLEKELNHIFHKLAMPQIKFFIALKMKKKLSPLGVDEINFQIQSANQEKRNLKQILSGGELSRIMLAIISILTEYDKDILLVFDEIDAGIGGEVGIILGEYLKKLAFNKQIICITHLASVASFAQNHIKIEKYTLANSPEPHNETEISESVMLAKILNQDERYFELARMLSGGKHDISLEHAKQLLDTANRLS